MEADRYRHILFFRVWFLPLGLYAVIHLRNETNTPTFKAALLTVLITFAGIIALAARLIPYGGGYVATKWAARALVRTFQMENPDIRFFELRPGAVDTYFAGSKPRKAQGAGLS